MKSFKTWPRWLFVLGAVLLLLLGVGVYLWTHPELLVRWFGPPRVTMKEVYRTKSGGPQVDHALFDRLLQQYVSKGGWVDYRRLQKNQTLLNRYIEVVGKAPFAALGRNEKLALLINAYNAFTIKLILEHFPLASIKDLPTAKRWEDRRWKVGPHVWTLNQIEHEQIRPKFREPRIHFALVCAAVGCPPLRRKTYTAARLEQQLAAQARYVHQHKTWFRLKPATQVVYLTPLYLWYSNDFKQVGGSMLTYAARYAPALKQMLQAGKKPDIKWLSYDWSLNSVENRKPR